MGVTPDRAAFKTTCSRLTLLSPPFIFSYLLLPPLTSSYLLLTYLLTPLSRPDGRVLLDRSSQERPCDRYHSSAASPSERPNRQSPALAHADWTRSCVDWERNRGMTQDGSHVRKRKPNAEVIETEPPHEKERFGAEEKAGGSEEFAIQILSSS